MKKSNYDGVIGWVKYIIDYPYNKIDLELLDGERKENHDAKQKLRDKIHDEIINRKLIEKVKDNLIALRNRRIGVLTTKCNDYSKTIDELRSVIETQNKENEKLQEKVKEKELARRKNAGAIGGLKAENNKLKQDLERANQKITWLKTNQKAPTKEEIIAYETRQREVEKRQKNGTIQQ